MAEVIFPDVANAFLKADAIRTNEVRNRILQTQAEREADQYQRGIRARAVFDPRNPNSALDAFKEDPGTGAQAQTFLTQNQAYDATKREHLKLEQFRAAVAVKGVPPEQQPAEYARQRQRLIQLGSDPANIPEQFDARRLDAFIQGALTPEQYTQQPMVNGRPISQMGQPAIPPGYLNRTQQIESGGNPNAVSPTGASGPFQFTKGTAAQYGLTDRFDPAASRDAAGRLAMDNAKALTSRLGREPTAAELYLAHQQGAGGAGALLSNPNANVVDALAPAYGGDRIKAARAILVNGGTPSMTAGQFAQKWIAKYEGGGTAPAMTAPGMAGNLPSEAIGAGSYGAPPIMAQGGPEMATGSPMAALPPGVGPQPFKPAPVPVAPPAGTPPGSAPLAITRGGILDTKGAPSDHSWGFDPVTGKQVAIPIPGVQDKELASVVDPSSPTGVRSVRRDQAVGQIPGESLHKQRENINKLADDFRADKNIQKYQTVAPIMASVRDAIKRPGGAADLNMVYAMAKILDPESVVREGETIMVTKSGGAIEQIMGMIQSVNKGQRLTEPVRKQLMIELESRVKQLEKAHDSASKFYEKRAERLGIDPKEVLYDLGPRLGVVEDGHRYKGGDPADPANWTRVQ